MHADPSDPADRSLASAGTDAGAIDAAIRSEWPRVVATLVADMGNLADAEDAAQDAVEHALKTWPTSGLPDRPGAWLTTVARRRAIDRARRAGRGREKTELAARLASRHEMAPTTTDVRDDDMPIDPFDESLLRDEQLRLVFACCHPALKPEAQMALTLRSIGGLTTAEIARAFVQPEPTVAQRLVRAKKKIATAAIPFRIPPDAELLERTETVRSVIYLIFNEGHDTSAGEHLARTDLCDEAIRLCSWLVDLTPDDPESLGLLALLQLIHARRAARATETGDLVLLADQDRSQWDAALIEAGTTTLDRAMRLGRPGPYQIQAAINALHDEAPDIDTTDWPQIELLYSRLLDLSPTPVVTLNHAVAVSMTSGPQAALNLLDDANLSDRLDSYRHFHTTRGHLLAESDPALAADAFRRARALPGNDAENRWLDARLEELVE